ncbi:MAG: hypothetical protein Q7J98_10560 [Kiritimatiellia bacterium]|nr:hypothetical protein [Kiritimatiellia bacterium]
MKKYYTIFLVVTALFFLWAAWQTRLVLDQDRKQQNRASSVQTADTPPLVVLTTVALGGFRGLLVDILWIRLISLQKEGKVFEIAQLADWITKLEPQFTAVWAFHAWNMAYNISILYPNPEHRWLWVKNGIQLLRDNALKYNPDDPILYRELGWLYQHKIGQTWDDMHVYYKLKLALEMNELFAGPGLDYPKPDSKSEKIQKMRAEYKLLPEIMRAIEQDYGRLDWRLPETHAVYWAYRGLHEAARGKDTSACDHMLFQSMAAAFRQGRLFMDPNVFTYITTPRLDLLSGALKAYEDAIKRQKNDIFRSAYVNFLAEAVFILHAYGDDRQAQKLFDKMLSEEPRLQSQVSFEKYIHDCEQFDIAELSIPDAIARIEGLLYQSCRPSSNYSKTDQNELREKALRLWKQYSGNSKNRKYSEIFPPFALIDEQAQQRARDCKEADPRFAPQ